MEDLNGNSPPPCLLCIAGFSLRNLLNLRWAALEASDVTLRRYERKPNMPVSLPPGRLRQEKRESKLA